MRPILDCHIFAAIQFDIQELAAVGCEYKTVLGWEMKFGSWPLESSLFSLAERNETKKHHLTPSAADIEVRQFHSPNWSALKY